MLVTDLQSYYWACYLHFLDLLDLVQVDFTWREVVGVNLAIAPARDDCEPKVVPIADALLSILMQPDLSDPALYLVSDCLCCFGVCLELIIVSSSVWTGPQLNPNRWFDATHIAETNVYRLYSERKSCVRKIIGIVAC